MLFNIVSNNTKIKSIILKMICLNCVFASENKCLNFLIKKVNTFYGSFFLLFRSPHFLRKAAEKYWRVKFNLSILIYQQLGMLGHIIEIFFIFIYS